MKVTSIVNVQADFNSRQGNKRKKKSKEQDSSKSFKDSIAKLRMSNN